MENIVRVAGGLANKMFHCAFAIALAQRGNNVYIDTKLPQLEFAHDLLALHEIFPNLELQEKTCMPYKYAYDNSIIGKLMRRFPLVSREKYYISHSFLYDDCFMGKIKKDSYIIGYFQNEKYFENITESIRKNFKFANIEGDKNKYIVSQLEKEKSVSIHIRKGDGYATWPEFKGTCPPEYYKRAVDYLRERQSGLTFYVFTDSVDWVKSNMGWLDDYTLVDWNPCVGWGNHFDMQLMSYCKHNIIANSTYSWWGAWLNSNDAKVVIAPAEWFNLCKKIRTQSDIVPDSWIKF